MKHKTKKIQPEEITPELAAYVVKTYLLPMFETDVKNHARKNRNKAMSKLESGGDVLSNSVYGELKLSDKLQIEIYSLREDKEKL